MIPLIILSSLGWKKIRSIEEKSEKLQEHFGSRVQAVAAAGLTLCQAQHMLCSRKGAFSPLDAYSLKSLVGYTAQVG